MQLHRTGVGGGGVCVNSVCVKILQLYLKDYFFNKNIKLKNSSFLDYHVC